MARRPRLSAPGLLYHVIARGNQRQTTFLGDGDYDAYLHRLGLYRARYDVSLHAYCLMPNHVHLLARTGAPPLAKFMQGLQQSYTQWFNRVHAKVGHLFQGRYRAIVCDSDEYLVTLVRYIHLNPVRAGLAPRPELYRYSGHRALLAGQPTAVLDPDPVLRLLGGPAAYARFTQDGADEGHQSGLYETQDQQVLGGQAFAGTVARQAGREPAPAPREPLGAALSRLEAALGLGTGLVRGPDRRHDVATARGLLALVLVRRRGYRLTDVARSLGRDPATLSVTVGRLARRLAHDEDLARTAERLENCLEVKV
jgi:REP element-mobilizing transposase RayT